MFLEEGNIWKEEEMNGIKFLTKWEEIGIREQLLLFHSSNISPTKTGRKAIRMIDDADKSVGGRLGSHYILY